MPLAQPGVPQLLLLFLFAGKALITAFFNAFFRDHYRVRGALPLTHILVSCLSLTALATGTAHTPFDPAIFHMFSQPEQLMLALVVVPGFAIAGACFTFATASMGYFIGFYLYTMLLSYLWLNCFSDLPYSHLLSGVSASLSGILFLLPILFVTRPLPQKLQLSIDALIDYF